MAFSQKHFGWQVKWQAEAERERERRRERHTRNLDAVGKLPKRSTKSIYRMGRKGSRVAGEEVEITF